MACQVLASAAAYLALASFQACRDWMVGAGLLDCQDSGVEVAAFRGPVFLEQVDVLLEVD